MRRRSDEEEAMRRSMVVGAVILAVLAVIGIGVAAFNAGLDEGISRELARSGDTEVVRVVGHGWGYGYGRGFGFPFGLILFPLFVIGVVLLVPGAFARGRWGGARRGGGGGPRPGRPPPASTSSPRGRPGPVTPPPGAAPGSRRAAPASPSRGGH